MKPIYFTLRSRQQLMILPDTLAHLDGHTVITESYSLFKDNGFTTPRLFHQREGELHLLRNQDPDYLGFLRFEVPDKLFTYTPADSARLDSEEIEQLIEWLTEVRSDPRLWPR